MLPPTLFTFDEVVRNLDSSCRQAETLFPQKLHNRNTERLYFGGERTCPIVISKFARCSNNPQISNNSR